VVERTVEKSLDHGLTNTLPSIRTSLLGLTSNLIAVPLLEEIMLFKAIRD
jgi:hypothetical protein